MNNPHRKMAWKYATSSFLIVAGFITIFTVTNFPNAVGQTMIDTSCPSCVTIPPNEIELYKELFPIIIWTADAVYDHDSQLIVNGYLKPENTFNPVTITVTNPIGNLVAVEQVSPTTDGNFVIEFNTGSVLWKQDGLYIIKAQSGDENRSFKTGIEIISLDLGTISQCTHSEITTNADNGGMYCIPFEFTGEITGIEGFLNTKSKTLVLEVRGSDVELLFIDIPQQILNAKDAGGINTEFVVLINNAPGDFEEQQSKFTNHRRLAIEYLPDREGTIEIIGTSVIPEFGSLTVLVLISAITAIVLISTRRNFVGGVIPSPPN